MGENKTAKPSEHDIAKHFPLIDYVIHKYCHVDLQRIGYDDLFQVGCLGLLQAIRRFDPDRGVKFSTFAVRTILGEMRRYTFRKDVPLKAERLTREIASKIRHNELSDRSPEEIASIFGCSVKVAKRALMYSHTRVLSMDQVLHSGERERLTVEDKVPIHSDFTEIFVKEFMHSLSERERKIIEMTVDGKRQFDIAEEIGVSQVHVSRLLNRIRKRYLEYLQAG